MHFLCGDLIVLLSDYVEAVCKNLQADHRVRLNQSERPRTVTGILIYLPGVLREDDSIVPEPAGGEERRALLC